MDLIEGDAGGVGKGERKDGGQALLQRHMKNVRVLYLVAMLSPVAFLLGYIVGAPKRVETPQVDFGGIDTRRLRVDGEQARLVDEGIRLAPNRDVVAR